MNKKQNIKSKKKAKGIRALYLHYCFLLKVYPKSKKLKYIYSAELKEEIKKMDMFSKEVRFMNKNNIQSLQELSAYKKYLIINKKENKSKIENLWKKHKKTKSEGEKQAIYEEIKTLQEETNKIKEEITLIEDIEIRTPKISKTINEIENENKNKEKEKENSEHIK